MPLSNVSSLIFQVQQLETSTVKTDHNNKIPHSVLPAGFSQVRVADLQMEALHAAAAAACRGSTRSGGTGCCENRVYPQSKGLSCTQVCANSSYKNCDAELAIKGLNRLARSSKDIVGYFYNYGCDNKIPNPSFETDIKASEKIDFPGTYYSFCCCRK